MRAFFDDSVGPGELLALARQESAAVRQEASHPIQVFEQENWHPILIGERFFVAPPWVTEAGPASRIRLEINADSAFGTGRHETTQLCIEALEQMLRPEQVVVDVGCGSGILSAAAGSLGARKIFSCDIHADSIVTAKQHVSTPVFVGSADAIATASADLVLANISAAVLDRLAGDLKRITKPGGCLILSGFIHERTPEFCLPERVIERDDWLCWICKLEDISPPHEDDAPEGLSHKAEWWL